MNMKLKQLYVAVTLTLSRGFALLAPMLLVAALLVATTGWAHTHVQPDVRLLIAQSETTPDAADAGTTLAGPDWSADLALLTADPTNPEALSKLILHAIMKGQWGLLVSLLLTALIAGLRKFVPEQTKVGQWFRSRVGAVVTNLSLSVGLGFVVTLLSGEPFSLAVVAKALTIAFTAAGTWSMVKAIGEARAEKAAQAAGEAATSQPGTSLDK